MHTEVDHRRDSMRLLGWLKGSGVLMAGLVAACLNLSGCKDEAPVDSPAKDATKKVAVKADPVDQVPELAPKVLEEPKTVYGPPPAPDVVPEPVPDATLDVVVAPDAVTLVQPVATTGLQVMLGEKQPEALGANLEAPVGLAVPGGGAMGMDEPANAPKSITAAFGTPRGYGGGTLDGPAVQAALEGKADALTRCFTDELLESDHHTNLNYIMKVDVGLDGTATASIDRALHGEEGAANCAAEIISSWEFPAPAGEAASFLITLVVRRK